MIKSEKSDERLVNLKILCDFYVILCDFIKKNDDSYW